MSISETIPTWAQDRETCFICCVACEESSRRQRDEAGYRSAAAGPDFREKHETSHGERCGGESGTWEQAYLGLEWGDESETATRLSRGEGESESEQIRSDISRFSPQFDRIFFWKELNPIFGDQYSCISRFRLHISVVIIDAEKFYLKLQVTKFKIQQTQNPEQLLKKMTP